MADEISKAPESSPAVAVASSENLPPKSEKKENPAPVIEPAKVGTAGDANGKPGILDRIVSSLPGKKRGPKGPWKHKEDASKIAAQAPVGIIPAATPEPSAVPKGFIKKTVRAFLGVIDGMVMRKVYAVTEKLSGDKKQAQNFAEQVAMTKEEADLISELTDVVAKKYGMTEEASPEILLGVAVLGYTTRTIIVFRRLDELAALHAPKPADKPQAN
jgi:hypothetical protein